MLHRGKCKCVDLLAFLFLKKKLLTESCSNVRKKRSLVLGCRAQRGQCLLAKGSLIDGHKETIGLAQSQWESAWSSVGRVEHSETDLSPSLPFSHKVYCRFDVWTPEQQEPYRTWKQK